MEVMMIVGACFVTNRRSRRLKTAHQSMLCQCGQRIVNGLSGNGTDLPAHRFRDLIGRCMSERVDTTQHRKSLSRDLKAGFFECFSWICLRARH